MDSGVDGVASSWLAICQPGTRKAGRFLIARLGRVNTGAPAFFLGKVMRDYEDYEDYEACLAADRDYDPDFHRG